MVLGLKADASERDVASAYRRAALKYHPDKNIGDPNAEAMFARVYAAYEILSSEEKRKEVDARRKADVQREERMRDMDVKRREMKEQLERRESQAKLEDEEKTNVQRKKKQISEETMARMRREIERLRREMEEEEHRREENANRSLRDAAVKKSTSVPYTILIRWDAEQARTESFLRSILETYVDDKALTFDVSRKGAMVTLTSPQMFKKVGVILLLNPNPYTPLLQSRKQCPNNLSHLYLQSDHGAQERTTQERPEDKGHGASRVRRYHNADHDQHYHNFSRSFGEAKADAMLRRFRSRRFDDDAKLIDNESREQVRQKLSPDLDACAITATNLLRRSQSVGL